MRDNGVADAFERRSARRRVARRPDDYAWSTAESAADVQWTDANGANQPWRTTIYSPRGSGLPTWRPTPTPEKERENT